jgi:predicted negative regulator of RcsB-dependent stress response
MKNRKTALAVVCMIIIAATAANAFAGRHSAEGEELNKIQSFLGLIDKYLSVGERWVKLVSARETTIYFVTERITEIYQANGDKADAIPELRKVLAKYQDNKTIANVIRFKIAEIYKDTGRATKALQELNAIVEADLKR